eukprot:4009073-Prymnesium_polylepis.4
MGVAHLLRHTLAAIPDHYGLGVVQLGQQVRLADTREGLRQVSVRLELTQRLLVPLDGRGLRLHARSPRLRIGDARPDLGIVNAVLRAVDGGLQRRVALVIRKAALLQVLELRDGLVDLGVQLGDRRVVQTKRRVLHVALRLAALGAAFLVVLCHILDQLKHNLGIGWRRRLSQLLHHGRDLLGRHLGEIVRDERRVLERLARHDRRERGA